MITKFEKGKRYRLDKNEFLKNEEGADWNADKDWFEMCLDMDKDVKVLNCNDGKIGIFDIEPFWCLEVQEEINGRS